MEALYAARYHLRDVAHKPFLMVTSRNICHVTSKAHTTAALQYSDYYGSNHFLEVHFRRPMIPRYVVLGATWRSSDRILAKSWEIDNGYVNSSWSR